MFFAKYCSFFTKYCPFFASGLIRRTRSANRFAKYCFFLQNIVLFLQNFPFGPCPLQIRLRTHPFGPSPLQIRLQTHPFGSSLLQIHLQTHPSQGCPLQDSNAEDWHGDTQGRCVGARRRILGDPTEANRKQRRPRNSFLGKGPKRSIRKVSREESRSGDGRLCVVGWWGLLGHLTGV